MRSLHESTTCTNYRHIAPVRSHLPSSILVNRFRLNLESMSKHIQYFKKFNFDSCQPPVATASKFIKVLRTSEINLENKNLINIHYFHLKLLLRQGYKAKINSEPVQRVSVVLSSTALDVCTFYNTVTWYVCTYKRGLEW
jgi:hypothetical protein